MTVPSAIEIRDLSFTYPNGAVALERVSLEAAQGEMVALIGPNGGGKSTLIRIVAGLLAGFRGLVRVQGLEPNEARRLGFVGYVPQRSEAERGFPVSARQAVEMAATARLTGWRFTPPEARARVDEALERVGAKAYARTPVGALSGGQWQRVMIARALAIRPRLLLLDEPLVGIDAAGQRLFASLLRDLRRDLGLTILLVTHDLRTAAGASAECDRVACLRRTLHFHAAPGGITPQVLAEVFQHDLADIFGEVHIDAHRASECAHGHSRSAPRESGGVP